MGKTGSSAPAEIIVDTEEEDIELSREKPEFVKRIEAFDIHNLTPENIKFMNGVIQETFREHLPVDPKLIDQIPSRMKIVNNMDFIRLREAANEETDADLGFYSQKYDQIWVNVEKHRDPGSLFTTMFHESLHFTSIQSGAGMTGDFCYPDPGEGDEVGEMMKDLDRGILTAVEGTTQLITQAYILEYMGFTPQEQMMSYEPECLIMSAVWEPFSKEERLEAYFNTPLELLRVRIEDAFAEDYDPDKPTGVFADCMMNIGVATKNIEKALESWRKNSVPEPVENVLKNVRHAVGLFIFRELESGVRKLNEEDKEYIRDYLEPYTSIE